MKEFAKIIQDIIDEHIENTHKQIRKCLQEKHSFDGKNDNYYKGTFDEYIAERLVTAGYGDTKQAVRDFTEKVEKLATVLTCPDEGYPNWFKLIIPLEEWNKLKKEVYSE